jgi:hypothetical protein
MKIKTLSLIILLLITTPTWGWRIERNILSLDKGDNLWQIAYSLSGDGNNWKKLWASRIDSHITNPHNAYPNMKFRLDTLIFAQNIKNNINHVEVDSSDFLARKFSLIEGKLLHIQNNTINLTPFEKVLVYFLAAITSIITGVLSSLGFVLIKKRYNNI